MSAPESLRDEVAAVLAEAYYESCGWDWAEIDDQDRADCIGTFLSTADALLASPVLARVIRERESACGCTPGTEENGWHETRCPSCAAKDRQQWADAMLKSEAFGGLIREVREQAWDEGYRAGCDDGHDHARGLAAGRPNPYQN